MTLNSWAAGESARAATVGWIVLAVAALALLIFGIVAASVASENLLDRVARLAPPGSVTRWSLLVGGIGFVALGFIVASWGIAIVGGVAVFIFWRLVDRNIY
ncbi:hypothetical protein GCM10010112_12660 [Actinoplanes lobatus]|uniref:Uncharacterized protein n=1 Tax=Actinoplanes lobatus TaxID=113568 RepID=A0A7W7MKI2_9ACTN|nr:hypothetical protein [Actinoplanes lobatus]MBB4753105.1 hypothetical protein [Actinoplanes lobatus]GGN58677.1 hypothetical protein GCM10010112_12660 [Actinoplanes lobatus]GIE43035.1 hypothetical protein Alo02nite_59330 [Actinoplanes lobatus]